MSPHTYTHPLSLIEVGKSHIGCVCEWTCVYISVEHLHLVSIGFKMEFNIVSESCPFTQLEFGPVHAKRWRIVTRSSHATCEREY